MATQTTLGGWTEGAKQALPLEAQLPLARLHESELAPVALAGVPRVAAGQVFGIY